MFRILRFTTSRDLDTQQGLKAIEAAQAAAEAARKVPGVRSCSLYLGAGALVFTAESDSYAVADKALADQGVQIAFGRLGWDYGYGLSGDEFLLDPEQVYPFLKAREGALATA